MIAAESVTKGHPDKICDQISDAVLDEVLSNDSNPENARVACECFCTTGAIVVGGEIRTDCYVDIDSIARNVVREIGYTHSDMGFDADTCSVWNIVQKQSPDIAMGVDGDSLGAGDQGIMFGYATNETESMMPLPIDMARCLSDALTSAREDGTLPYLRPDGKSQVAFDTDSDGRPTSLRSVVVSTQHSDDVTTKQLREDVMKRVIRPTLDVYGFSEENVDFYINPTGRFVIGGPHGDTGLTGRKIVVDQYGGACPVGGGAFSGKDPSKVDRSAAYMARHVAKRLVAARFADRCRIQVAYAIGVDAPVSIDVETFGTERVDKELIQSQAVEYFDWTPSGIIRYLDLWKPIYRKTAESGHFGRDFAWETKNMGLWLNERGYEG